MGFMKSKAAEIASAAQTPAAEPGARGRALADLVIHAVSEGPGSIEQNLQHLTDELKDRRSK